MLKYWTLIFLLLPGLHIHAQCPVNVTASASPSKVCQAGDQVTLNGSTTGTVSNILWEPSSQVNNPNNLVTTATVNFPTTFTLTVSSSSTTNLINNGDFEQGNVGFNSSFNYVVPGPGLLSGNTYTVLTSPSIVSSTFPTCGDHTSGSGLMAAYNAGNAPGGDVWCQTISVNPTSDYNFSLWVMSLLTISPFSPPVALDITINGVSIATHNAGSIICTWQQVAGTWSANGSNTAQICISNTNSGTIGPVFAIDDIMLTEQCVGTDDVVVDVVNLDAQIAPPLTLDCNNPVVVLDGSNSSFGPNITYIWSTPNGNIVSGGNTAFATVDLAGDYTLKVIYDDGTLRCETEETVNVEMAEEPIANASALDTLDCFTQSIFLSGAGSSIGGNFSYMWTTVFGNIISGANTLNPEVDEAGVYTLTVTNNLSLCTDSETVMVIDNGFMPFARISPPDEISCFNPNITLDGSSSIYSSTDIIEWISLDGNSITNSNTLMPGVTAPGTYRLIIKTGFCIDSAEVTVQERILDFDFITSADSIGCNGDILSIGVNHTFGTIQAASTWSTTNGNILSSPTASSIQVDEPGWYFLDFLLTGPSGSQCNLRDSIQIFPYTGLPIANAMPEGLINCENNSVIVNGSSSSYGFNIEYLWTTNNGNIISNNTLSEIVVDQIGTYQLIVSNIGINCADTTEVQVYEYFTNPSAVVDPADELNCNVPVVLIDGSSTSLGFDESFYWVNSVGTTLQSDSLKLEVSREDFYSLIIVDGQSLCKDTATVFVQEDFITPIMQVGFPDTLTCLIDTVSLSVQTNSNFSIHWTSVNGNILGPDTLNDIVVDTIGTYLVEVINPLNGCSSIDSVLVEQTRIYPFINVADSVLFECRFDSLQLITSGSSSGPDYSYDWLSLNGAQISTQTNTENPIVYGPGQFELMIRHLPTGCISIDTFNVIADTNFPTVSVLKSMDITCDTPFVTLDASLSDSSQNIAFVWSTTDGHFYSGLDTYHPVVDAAGTYTLILENTPSGCENSDQIEVLVDTIPPLAIITFPDTINCAKDTVLLDASLSSNGPLMDYEWSFNSGVLISGLNLDSLTIDAPGLYSVVILNRENGCLNDFSVTVIENRDLPQIQLLDTAIINCRDTLANILPQFSVPNTDLSTIWTTSSGSIISNPSDATLIADSQGLYFLEIVNQVNRCPAIDSIRIIEDILTPIATISGMDTLTCSNLFVDLEVSGNAAYTYQWNNGDTGDRISTDTAGYFGVLVTDQNNGCTNFFSTTIIQNIEKPEFQLDSLMHLLCSSDSLEIELKNISTQQFDLHWTNPLGVSQTIPGDSIFYIQNTGRHFVLLTDLVNGCNKIDSFLVSTPLGIPELTAEPIDTLTCEVDTVLISVNTTSNPQNLLFDWSNSNGQFTSGSLASTILVTSPGDFQVFVLDTTNQCSASLDLIATANVQVPLAEAGRDTSLNCVNDPIYLAATDLNLSNITYVWTDENFGVLNLNNSPQIEVNSPAWYFLRVRNEENGCEAFDSLFVSAVIDPLIDFDLTVDQPTCLRNWATISINNIQGGLSPLDIYLGGELLRLENIPDLNIYPGEYQLSLIDSNRCELDTVFQVLEVVLPVIQIPEEIEVLLGSNNRLNPVLNLDAQEIDSIIWSPTIGLSCSNCLNPTFVGTEDVAYEIRVISKSGCEANASIMIRVRSESNIYVPHAFSPNDDGINDHFRVFSNSSIKQIKSYLIFDRWGSLIFKAENFLIDNEDLTWDGTFNGEKLNPGVFVYLIEVELLNGEILQLRGDISMIY